MGSNRLAIRNMLILFGRMTITMGINLYSSRIILKALGVDDYGLYSVVAGMVMALSFLHYALNGATVRFINIEFANNNYHKLNELFNNLFLIHLIIGIIIVLICESIGIYLIYNYLNIPENRLTAAKYVLHFSIAAMFLNVIQVPYDSTIIAHQKMNILAYVSILESFLKLMCGFSVLFTKLDHLILYSFLLLLVSFITRLVYQMYCKVNFKETKLNLHIRFDTDLLKKVSVYFGWDLLGNISSLLRIQGINTLQNIFFGTIVNAAMGIASTVANAISSLVTNVSFALKPQIFQYYSIGNKSKCFYLVNIGAKLSFYLLMLIFIPFFFHINFFLNIWLTVVPKDSENFTRLLLISILCGTIFDYTAIIINANGKIKSLSIIGTFLYGGSFIFSLILLEQGFGKYTVSYIHILTTLLMGISNIIIVKKIEPDFKVDEFLFEVVFRCFLIFSIVSIACYILLSFIKLNTIYLIIIEIIITLILIALIGIKKNEKIQIKSLIKSRLKL